MEDLAAAGPDAEPARGGETNHRAIGKTQRGGFAGGGYHLADVPGGGLHRAMGKPPPGEQGGDRGGASQPATRDRKAKKGQFRALWIQRINAAARIFDPALTYSRLINGLAKAGIEVDRKVLADLAVHEPEAFNAIADKARAALA